MFDAVFINELILVIMRFIWTQKNAHDLFLFFFVKEIKYKSFIIRCERGKTEKQSQLDGDKTIEIDCYRTLIFSAH